MKISISDSAISAFAKLAISARVLFGVLIDMPELFNAGWLSILLGGLLAFPLVFALSKLCDHRNIIPVLAKNSIYAVFSTIALFDAAVVTAGIADSASYLALNSTAAAYLMIPLFILCLCCMRLNADAVGASAAIWGKILPWLIVIVICLQIDEYHPHWLTPVLGPGISTILTGSVRISSWLILPSALCLVTKPNISAPKQTKPLRILAFNVLFAAFVAAITGMMTPVIQSDNLFARSFRLDILLVNGRSGLSLQFPVIALWYISLFYALLFDAVTAAVFLQLLFPKWSGYACMWSSVIIIAIIAFSKLSTRHAALTISDWLFVIQGVSIALGMLSITVKRRSRARA